MSAAFRTCDVRGIYPSEVNAPLFLKFGRFIAREYARKGCVLVGSDFRHSSPALQAALIQGLVAGGATVIDGGCIPTPIVYFGHHTLGCSVSCAVTASHNTPPFNGLKLLIGAGTALPGHINDLRRALTDETSFVDGGSVRSLDIASQYCIHISKRWQQVFSQIPKGATRSLVIDPGGGAWSRLAFKIIRDLGIQCCAVNDDPDPHFRHRSPDCSRPGALATLAAEVRKTGGAAGFAWDGDGDRLGVCDENGTPIIPDHVAMLLLRHSSISPGDRILVDIKMSSRIRKTIEELRCIPIIEKSAHCLLERTMMQQDCRFGCEFSGHYFWSELRGADDALYSALYLALCALSNRESLSTLVKELPRLFLTPDLRFAGSSAEFARITAQLRKHFSGATFQELDGVKVELPAAWFLIRQSVSENKLSCRFEGDTADDLRSIVNEVLACLGDFGRPLQSVLQKWARQPGVGGYSAEDLAEE